jgi:hypothetical protein
MGASPERSYVDHGLTGTWFLLLVGAALVPPFASTNRFVASSVLPS